MAFLSLLDLDRDGTVSEDEPLCSTRVRVAVAFRTRITEADEAAAGEKLRRARATLSAPRVEAARQWFDAIDVDAGGTLDEDEVFRAVRRMLPSEDVSRGLIGDLFREIDVDRSGDIDFDEFLLLVTELDSGNIDFREFADGRWA